MTGSADEAVDPSVAVRRVRTLAGAVVVLNWLVTSEDHDVTGTEARLVALSLCMIALVNVLASRRVVQKAFPRLGAGVADAAVDVVWAVSVCAAAQDPTEAPWIVLLIPVIGAVAQSSMSVALLVWAVQAFAYLFVRLSIMQGAPAGTVGAELSPIVEQLGLILLVVLPAGYLTEQLAADVGRQRRATAAAEDRNRMLQTVADVGSRMAHLGVNAGDLVCEGAKRLGFTRVTVYRKVANGWARATSAPPSGDLDAPSPGLVPLDDEQTISVPLSDGPQGIVLQASAAEAVTIDQRTALDLLGRHASVAARNAQLLARLRQMHEDLDRRANRDSLTGLPNRHRLGQVLDQLGDAPLPADTCVALLFLDLDGFKPVNDRLGHDAGDALLKAIATRLRTAAREADFVARLGGDEFTVLSRVRHLNEAIELAHRLVAVVNEPLEVVGTSVRVGVSIGVAPWCAGVSPQELMRRADVAMYQAKSAGRGTVRTYSVDLDLEEHRTFRLLSDVERALRDDLLALVYQPILSAEDPGDVVGFEALLRWHHPELGAIAPDEIIELVRRRNLTGTLTEWIVRRSLRDLGRAREATGGHQFVTVNLSPHELALPGLEALITQASAHSGMSPHGLVIEINEGTLITPGTVERMQALRSLGVRLFIDGWGQKATSLAQVRLPVDGIKLDRSLFASDEDGLNRLIVESVSAVAQRRGLLVVAEGLERPVDFEVARSARCDLVQGYLFHRPVMIDELLLASVGP